MLGRIGIALVALLASSCSSSGNFHVPHGEFLDTTKTLLVFPLEGPQFDAADLARLDAAVLETMTRFGYQTVDGSILDDFDRRTSGVDAVLFKGLVAREAFFDDSGAEFDGIECELELPSSGPWGYDEDVSGKATGLSLYISIADPEGNLRYEGFGGIGLLRRWNGSEYEELDPAPLLRERDAVLRAVQIALAPLER